MTRRKRFSRPRPAALPDRTEAEAAQIAAYLHENHILILPPAAAHILGETSPGWRREAEAKANKPGKSRAKSAAKYQKRLARRLMPDELTAFDRVPYRRKDAPAPLPPSVNPELRKSPRQAVQAETKDRTTSPGTETTSPSQQGKKPT